jgi:hypothetical protein
MRLVAVMMRDGKPTMIVVSCDSRLGVASVYVDDPAPSPSPGSSPMGLVSWQVISDSPARVTEMVMLDPPPSGWRVDEDEIRELIPGVHYAADGIRSFPVRFTTADLEKLDDDEVLVDDDVRDRDNKVITRSRFESSAKDSCDRDHRFQPSTGP